jgi:predicted GH43/DUF377 family glycosyl hydrolase
MWEKADLFRTWLTKSRIVRAVAEKPEGPFTIVEELSVLNEQEWSKKSAHNPTVKKINDKYYLFYMGTTYKDSEADLSDGVRYHPARFNQCIGVAVASSPEGPWIPSKNNPVLQPREGYWDNTFVSNPSIFVEDNEIKMIYKAKWHTDNRLILGLAVANNPEGPYERKGPSPIFEYDVEDPFIWKEDEKYWMIAKDMTGDIVGKYNGVLFESDNGMDWALAENALAWNHELIFKDGDRLLPKYMERPQLLIEDGKPICFYTAIGDYDNYSYNLARRIK